MNGKVKFYNENKGFGFIDGEDGQDYFFHVSQIQGDNSVPREGDNVEFTAAKNDKGLAANNVLVV